MACAFLQTDALARCRRGLPLRYPLLCVLLLLVAPVSAWYGVTHAAPLFVAGAVLLAGISLYAAWTYHRTGIDYTSDCFTFRAGSQLKTFSFSRTVCLVLCTEEGNVVLYSNMQGFSAFLETAYTNWCRQKGLDPQAQDWHNPADHRWFPDQPDETH